MTLLFQRIATDATAEKKTSLCKQDFVIQIAIVRAIQSNKLLFFG